MLTQATRVVSSSQILPETLIKYARKNISIFSNLCRPPSVVSSSHINPGAILLYGFFFLLCFSFLYFHFFFHFLLYILKAKKIMGNQSFKIKYPKIIFKIIQLATFLSFKAAGNFKNITTMVGWTTIERMNCGSQRTPRICIIWKLFRQHA